MAFYSLGWPSCLTKSLSLSCWPKPFQWLLWNIAGLYFYLLAYYLDYSWGPVAYYSPGPWGKVLAPCLLSRLLHYSVQMWQGEAALRDYCPPLPPSLSAVKGWFNLYPTCQQLIVNSPRTCRPSSYIRKSTMIPFFLVVICSVLELLY